MIGMVSFHVPVLIIIVVGLTPGFAQTNGEIGQPRHRDWRSAEFRYVIYSNEANIDDPGKLIRRDIYVLLEERAFSIDNLRKLLILLSRRFPTPDWLVAWVNTSLMQIPTPEELDGGVVSERPWIDPLEGDHPGAVLIRIGDNEILRYTPGPPYHNMKTIVLKGTDPPTLTNDKPGK
ncbi:MAG: hypothetical protein AB1898_23860 [Acidobacteriota bacterium]